MRQIRQWNAFIIEDTDDREVPSRPLPALFLYYPPPSLSSGSSKAVAKWLRNPSSDKPTNYVRLMSASVGNE